MNKVVEIKMLTILKNIESVAGYVPVAENNHWGLMHSTLCTTCGKQSYFIHKGESVCLDHYKNSKKLFPSLREKL